MRHTVTDAADLGPTDYVWISTRWPNEIVYHQPRHDRDDREVTLPATRTQPERTGLVAGWAWTVCGQVTHHLQWDADASPRSGRIYIGTERGDYLPLRLLNPAVVRPCRRCFPESA